MTGPDGADTLWRGNVAEQNFLNGFFVSLGGAFNTFLDNRSKNNYGDGFNVPGAGNVFDKNQATCNQQDGFDVTGAENSFDNSRSCGNAVNPADFEYRLAGPGTVDTGGNRVCNMPVTLDTPFHCELILLLGHCLGFHIAVAGSAINLTYNHMLRVIKIYVIRQVVNFYPAQRILF